MNNNKHSDYQNTINLIHNAQGYPMIGVTFLSGTINNVWHTFHYLFVRLNSHQMVEYCFILGNNGIDYLEGIRVVDKSFDEVLVEQSHRVIADGQATLVVYPM